MKTYFSLIPACYLVLKKQGNILLLRRFNTGYCDGQYSLIAGHVEGDESFREAAKREAKEEAGVDLAVDDLKLAHVMHRARTGVGANAERIDLFFTTERWSGEIVNNEPNKCDDLSWFPEDQLPENVIPYIRQALEAIENGEKYSESGFELL